MAPSSGGTATVYTAGINTAQVNAGVLQAKAAASIDLNNTYLAIATPTNAQVAAQVNRLTRENTAIIRLLLNQTDDTAGT